MRCCTHLFPAATLHGAGGGGGGDGVRAGTFITAGLSTSSSFMFSNGAGNSTGGTTCGPMFNCPCNEGWSMMCSSVDISKF